MSFPNVHVCEIIPELRADLVGRWFTLLPSADGDFLGVAPTASFDRVLMNPPFEDGSDTRHVLHAYRFLRPGGRLVAIMTPGFTFRADGAALRALVAEHGP